MEIIYLAVIAYSIIGVFWLKSEYQYKQSKKREEDWRFKMDSLTEDEIYEIHKNAKPINTFNYDAKNWDISKVPSFNDMFKKTRGQ